MSQIPMEYKVMKKKFFKGIEKALGSDLVGIVVYGGSASERIFSGVSDIDFFIILNKVSELAKPLSEVYQILSTQILEYLENPLFSSILDYDIYTLDQLPTEGNLNGFSSIRAFCLKNGELLTGSNPFENIELSDDQILEGARRMVQEYLDKLSSPLFMPMFDLDPETGEPIDDPNLDGDKEFLAVDAVLSCMQAYHLVKRKEYVNMPDIVLFAETEPVDGLDNDLVKTAGLLKQGVETDVTDFYNRSINFCGNIIKMLK